MVESFDNENLGTTISIHENIPHSSTEVTITAIDDILTNEQSETNFSNEDPELDAENSDERKRLAKEFVKKLLLSSYQGTLLYQGYFEDQKNLSEDLQQPEADESSEDEMNEDAHEDNDEELIYVPEKKTMIDIKWLQ